VPFGDASRRQHHSRAVGCYAHPLVHAPHAGHEAVEAVGGGLHRLPSLQAPELVHAGVLAVTYLDVDGVTAEAWVFRRGEWREAWLRPAGTDERLQYVAAEGGQLPDRSPWSE